MLSMIVNTGSSPQRKESGQQRCYVGIDFLNGFKVRHGELENPEVASLESWSQHQVGSAGRHTSGSERGRSERGGRNSPSTCRRPINLRGWSSWPFGRRRNV